MKLHVLGFNVNKKIERFGLKIWGPEESQKIENNVGVRYYGLSLAEIILAPFYPGQHFHSFFRCDIFYMKMVTFTYHFQISFMHAVMCVCVNATCVTFTYVNGCNQTTP